MSQPAELTVSPLPLCSLSGSAVPRGWTAAVANGCTAAGWTSGTGEVWGFAFTLSHSLGQEMGVPWALACVALPYTGWGAPCQVVSHAGDKIGQAFPHEQNDQETCRVWA